MKKRMLSILLMCCMVLTLLPTTAFAEESTETPPVCSCETACTTDNMDKECPVCGAENAIPQNCGQYIPVEDRTGENGSTERADDPNGPTELSAADQVRQSTPSRPRTSARASAFSRKNSRRFWKTGVSATAGFRSLRSSPRWKP